MKQKKFKKHLIRMTFMILAGVSLFFFTSCESNSNTIEKISDDIPIIAEIEDEDVIEGDTNQDNLSDINCDNNKKEEIQQKEDDSYSTQVDESTIEVDAQSNVNNSYSIIANNTPGFSDEEKTRTDYFEYYSELDSLGRCGAAFANICKESMPSEERGSIGMIKPSGWHTVKYNNLIEGNYLYNRCHLIGYQLASENDNEKNLITGTRYLNMVGMLQFENEVAAYVEETNNHVLYRITPIFENNNLVASGVQMEGWSVEDGGIGVCFNVYCYNIQPGIIIDYATGDSYEDPDYVFSRLKVDDLSVSEKKGNESSVSGKNEADYVINKNTHKIHLPSCSSVNDMKEKNKGYYTGTIEDLIEEGYSPCKRCMP